VTSLVVPIYANRSKAGNLRLLRQFADRHQVGLIAIANRPDGLLDGFFDEVLVADFACRADVRDAFTAWVSRHGTPAGVFCLGEDEVPLCADLSAQAGLPGNDAAAALVSRSKEAMRAALRGSGVPMPRSFPARSLAAARRLLHEELRGGPAFLKPALGTGSMHCCEISGQDALAAAWPEMFEASRQTALADPLYEDVFGGGYFMLLEDLIGSYSLPAERVLAGRFPVHELSVEAVIDGGLAHVYGITDKLLPPHANGREHMWRTSRVPGQLRRALADQVTSIAEVFGLRVGAMHAEFRLEPARDTADATIGGAAVQATLLEVAARMGGAYMQSFWLRATGFDAVDWLARQACGLPVGPPAVAAINPAIMVNLWPESSGALRGVRGLDELTARSGSDLDEVMLYDEAGDAVDCGHGAERGIGHIAFRAAEVDARTAPGPVTDAAYDRLERLYLHAYDHVRGIT
jgi:biotin carboxylase